MGEVVGDMPGAVGAVRSTPTELALTLETLKARSLTDVTHVLLNLNEFLYLR